MAKNRTTVWTIRLRTIADTVNLKSVPRVMRPVVKAFDNLGKTLPRIRYQWLSVMFAGMQIKKLFGGMINPVAQMVGLFEPLGYIMEEALIPVLEPMTDLLWVVADAFESLPENVKENIGMLLVAGFLFGNFLQLFGQLGTAIGDVSGFLGSLIPNIGIFGRSLGEMGGKALGVGLSVMTLNSVLEMAFGKNLVDVIGEGVNAFQKFMNKSKDLKKSLETDADTTVSEVKLSYSYLPSDLNTYFKQVAENAKTNATNVKNAFTGAVDSVKNKVDTIISQMDTLKSSPVGQFIEMVKEIVSNRSFSLGGLIGGATRSLIDWFSGGFPTRQYGGFIPATGLYMLHAGETVNTPGTGMTFAPNITIHATLTQPMDIRAIADELERHWADRYGVRI